MGKQSRKGSVAASKSNKKKNKSNKEEHKRELQERQRRREEQERQNLAEELLENEPEVLLEGDRVWITGKHHPGIRFDEDNPDTYRGVIVSLSQDKTVVDVRPFYFPENAEPVSVPVKNVFRDVWDELTLNHKVGDAVFCVTEDGYRPGVVTHLWPIWEANNEESNNYATYKCDAFAKDGSPEEVWTADELDARPLSFRFKVGDPVLVNSQRVDWKDGRYPTSIEEFGVCCEVTAPLRGGGDYLHCVYECSVLPHNKVKQPICFIYQDTDEYITSVNRSARERLVDSIQQDCGFYHISRLIESSHLDVSSIEALVLQESITYASFDMLSWMEQNLSFELKSVCDSNGNYIQHQLARSLHATRFFKKVNLSMLAEDDSKTPKLSIFDDLFKSKPLRLNGDGESFLDILVKVGHDRALDILLSPRSGFFQRAATLLVKDEDMERLVAAAMGAPSTTKRILTTFRLNRDLHSQRNHLDVATEKTEEAFLCHKGFQSFLNPELPSPEERLIRYAHEYDDNNRYVRGRSIETNILHLARKGFDGIFLRFFKVDRQALLATTLWYASGETQNELVQTELYGVEFDDPYEDFGIVNIIARGPSGKDHPYYPRGASEYLESLRHYVYESFHSENDTSLMDHLKKELTRTKKEGEHSLELKYLARIFGHKIYQLEDDDSLPRRLTMLDMLVQQENQAPPSALDAIRFRQCGVLRWLVRNEIVDLGSTAASQGMLTTPRARKMKFLDRRKVPASTSTAGFLLFSAIEYDDLQALEWMIQQAGISLESLMLYGFNVVHACAFFGRLEIIIWLARHSSWHVLVKQFSNRKAFEHYCASHIAVAQGHTLAADILLRLGAPIIDGNKRSCTYYGKKSPHPFVQKWAEEMDKEERGPLQLEKDCQKLLQLLGVQNITGARASLESTRCLEIRRWRDCGLFSFDKTLPCGRTYKGILIECLELSMANEEFVLWLCTLVSQSEFSQTFLSFTVREFWAQQFWKQEDNSRELCFSELVSFFATHKELELCGWLQKAYTKDITCFDPDDANPILKHQILPVAMATKFSAKLLRIQVLGEVMACTSQQVGYLIRSGVDSHSVEAEITVFMTASVRRAEEHNMPIRDYKKSWEWDLIQLDDKRPINMEGSLFIDNYYEKAHPCRRQRHFRGRSNHEIHSVSRILAIENHSELTRWCLTRGQKWTAEMECDMMRIAAYLGNSATVSVLSGHESTHEFLSTAAERSIARLLGTAEAGLDEDFSRQIEILRPLPVNDPLDDAMNVQDMKSDEVESMLASSLPVAVVYGFLAPDTKDSESSGGDSSFHEGLERIMHHMINASLASAHTFFNASVFILSHHSYGARWECLVDFTKLLKNKFDLLIMSQACQDKLMLVSSNLLMRLTWSEQYRTELLEVAHRWLELLVSWGVDIQTLKIDTFHESEALEMIHSVQLDQRKSWSKFDVVKTKQPLETLKDCFRLGTLTFSERDKGGLTVAHVAAAYDRVDLLQWLVEEKNVDLDSKDGQDRTVLDVALASQAAEAIRWIQTRKSKAVISSFLSTHFHRRLAVQRKQKLLRGVVALQARYRSAAVLRVFRERLLSRMDAAQQFHVTWDPVINILSESFDSDLTWTHLREKLIDMRTTNENALDEMLATGQTLENAAVDALVKQEEDDETENDFEEEDEMVDDGGTGSAFSTDASVLPCLSKDTNILLSSFVTKWLKQCDPKFHTFFMRRLQQLQNGDRSRILAKRLKGSQSTIFETYLEQKSGHRILWTERNGVREILIWYVAKHKAVSRLMKLIDDSQSRGSRQRMPAPNFGPHPQASLNENENEVVLDPLGNVPLRMYEIQYDELEEAIVDDSWVPRLYLSKEERSVVETRGTLLLLGRSGTGKTVCICNRMELDRLRSSHDAMFRQLFVARSKRLKRYVAGAVGHHACASYQVFDEVVQMLEARLPKLGSSEQHETVFLPSQRMGFAKFKTLICSSSTNTSVDPLIAWTCIRSFLKGSIEAVLEPSRVLPREKFMVLGKKRCRISPELRKSVYDIFEKYQRVTRELKMWDDCDRMMTLLERMDRAMASDPDLFQALRQSKIYVDEVQDYLQIEILLFFKLSGPGALFLAGDPAQSVVEGVEFRFQDVRSVGYHIVDHDGQGMHQRDLIPAKPFTVNVNFRSHSGILNVAASVLRCLFRVFPDSAQQLKEDRGVFAGPRPGVLYNLDPKLLSVLLREKMNGAVVLAHDGVVSHWKERLGYPLVYGIREAKGLEFKNVILLNFFSEIPSSLQKPWRDLLLGREGAASHVELEGHLKLLYTGVTRCIERLFVVETKKSIAGDAMTRWLTATTTLDSTVGLTEALATKNNVNNIEAMALTSDEWTVSGIENAEMAENSEDLDESKAFLEKAVFCFEQAKNVKLGRRARAHRSSLLFRWKVAQRKEASLLDGSELVESEAARLMKLLLEEGLGGEASKLGETILPFLSEVAREKLQSTIFSKLEQTEVL